MARALSEARAVGARLSRPLSLLDVLQRDRSRRVFVHDFASMNVPEMKSATDCMQDVYAERALMMAQAGDLVVVAEPVDTEYLAYLEEVGVGPGEDGVFALNRESTAAADVPLLEALAGNARGLDRLAERLHGTRVPRLSPYYMTASVRRLQTELQKRLARTVTVDGGGCEVAELANRKEVMREAASTLAVPVARGEVVDVTHLGHREAAEQLLVAVARHQAHTGSVMIRGAWSMMGLDNLKVSSKPAHEAMAAWLSRRPHLGVYLVESLIPVTASPNVQLWIADDGAVELLETTNQRLDEGAAHFGNVYPHASDVTDAIGRSAMRLAGWLSKRGYRGALGIDFIETTDPVSGAPTHAFAEVNGRINGATYVLALAERINQVRLSMRRPALRSWRTNKFVVGGCRDFAELRRIVGDSLYSHRSAGGVFPYGPGLLRAGLALVAILATSEADAESIEAELAKRLRDA